MKKTKSQGLLLIGYAILFVFFSGCNSSQENQTKEEVEFNQEAFNQQLQGVFEMLPPYQGYAIYLDDYFVVCYGMSDSTMIGAGGKYEISDEMITDYFQFSTDPTKASSTKWSAEMLEGDILKGTMFNDDGGVFGVFEMVKKVDPTEELRSQMKEIEGMFQYLPPLQGLGTNLGGYFIYLYGQPDNRMTVNAGTYEDHDDIITNKYLFSTNYQLVGGEFNWVNQSAEGDTLTYAILNDAKEISSTGKSVRAK